MEHFKQYLFLPYTVGEIPLTTKKITWILRVKKCTWFTSDTWFLEDFHTYWLCVVNLFYFFSFNTQLIYFYLTFYFSSIWSNVFIFTCSQHPLFHSFKHCKCCNVVGFRHDVSTYYLLMSLDVSVNSFQGIICFSYDHIVINYIKCVWFYIRVPVTWRVILCTF